MTISKTMEGIAITVQKMKFSIKDFISKYDQIRSMLSQEAHLEPIGTSIISLFYENSYRLKAVNYIRQKSFIVYVRLGSKYNSDLGIVSTPAINVVMKGISRMFSKEND